MPMPRNGIRQSQGDFGGDSARGALQVRPLSVDRNSSNWSWLVIALVNHAASVRLVMEDGSEYAQSGRLLFSDVTVDPSSGQVTLRAEIPNPDGVLFPGLYVRVRLEESLASNAIVLPQQSLTRSPQGDTVMVVDSEGKVKPRPVKVGGQRGTQWVVTEGLQAGEQVMVDGFQKLRGDAPVKPVPWTPPGSPAPAAPAPAASR